MEKDRKADMDAKDINSIDEHTEEIKDDINIENTDMDMSTDENTKKKVIDFTKC